MSHISDSQLRRVIERFTDKGLIIKSGKTVNTVYTLSPDYLQRIEVLNQATKIGLTQMLNGNIGSDGINDGTNVKSQANNEEKRSQFPHKYLIISNIEVAEQVTEYIRRKVHEVITI